MMKTHLIATLLLCCALHPLSATNQWIRPADLPEVPPEPPRTWILKDQQERFAKYCLEGEDARFFANLKADFDRQYLHVAFPAEPESFGDSNPSTRTSDKIDAWREAQDTCNLAAGVASTAAIIWRATGEQAYLDKAREFLLGVTEWDLDGATNILYNDETNFRLLRLLPETYDQIRDELTPEERTRVLDMFRARGNLTFQHMLDNRTGLVIRNSLLVEPSSHPVRFVPMLGLMGLALWDDLPEAQDWFAFAYRFYREQFPPWGGDDGGWAEGLAYWRGTIEHASFQDGLWLIGAPEAYANPFWKRTFYFPVYFLTPWASTAYGDTPLAGKIGMEPGIRDIIVHAAKIYQDGYLSAYAALYEDRHPFPENDTEFKLWRKYPIPVEYLLRDFLVSDLPLPPALDLDKLPGSTYLKDIGWVAMHTNLGSPKKDIFLQFKSSPYGSYSHSHADQNSIIVSAYGEPFLINSGYREYHRSPHHQGHTRQTLSKNNLLINGQGQPAQNKMAKGKITGYQATPDFTWARGDATAAYKANPKLSKVRLAQREVIMLPDGLIISRDEVQLDEPGVVQWLLHSVNAPETDASTSTVTLHSGDKGMRVALASLDSPLSFSVSDTFTVPVDPKYLNKGYVPQYHLTATTETPAARQVIYAVMTPLDAPGHPGATILDAADDHLSVVCADGERFRLVFTQAGPEKLAMEPTSGKTN
ncbi:heparinase II/III family protein [Ruficoccus amylovorans]|uniref:Heparinase II/III family protein n=1 Tax=Ruficoccus amylovorans TaxID=1804625 RepID=A0A842HGZ3_9BACT|nr:heparinase II/III family protein [Ruficoccus amylovorans]MBC2595450.1 heparinase II/III family protein [Ruficoccus amylovorans]